MIMGVAVLITAAIIVQIERKLAPFWRGLNDFDSSWTEPQMIAAARGFPIPAADETPPDELVQSYMREIARGYGVDCPGLTDVVDNEEPKDGDGGVKVRSRSLFP